MLRINTLVKPTHQCNMRCKYCFAEKYGYDNSLLDIDYLKKYLSLLSQKFQFINLVWHGGEPLMVPLDFYDEIYDYCSEMDTKFIYSLQTNGVLLNQENIDLLKMNGMFPGAVLVVTQNNVDHLVEEYEYFKSLDIGMKVNPMFSDGTAKDNPFLTMDPDQYIKNFVTFFKYWPLDTNCILMFQLV